MPLRPQDLTQREYFGTGTPENGWLAWSRPAREVFNFVRTADYFPFPSPWQHPRSRLGDQEIPFVKAVLTGQSCDAPPGTNGWPEGERVQVACVDECVAVSRLILNGRYVGAVDVLKPGERLESGVIDLVTMHSFATLRGSLLS